MKENGQTPQDFALLGAVMDISPLGDTEAFIRPRILALAQIALKDKDLESAIWLAEKASQRHHLREK